MLVLTRKSQEAVVVGFGRQGDGRHADSILGHRGEVKIIDPWRRPRPPGSSAGPSPAAPAKRP